MSWFYLHCVVAVIILVKDHNGTLEESLDNFEKSVGLYTYLDTTEGEADVPYYIPSMETKVDSSFILPDSLKIKTIKEVKHLKEDEKENIKEGR